MQLSYPLQYDGNPRQTADQVAELDLLGMLLVPPVDGDGERRRQFRVADGMRGREQPRPGDDDLVGTHRYPLVDRP